MAWERCLFCLFRQSDQRAVIGQNVLQFCYIDVPDSGIPSYCLGNCGSGRFPDTGCDRHDPEGGMRFMGGGDRTTGDQKILRTLGG